MDEKAPRSRIRATGTGAMTSAGGGVEHGPAVGASHGQLDGKVRSAVEPRRGQGGVIARPAPDAYGTDLMR